MLIQTITLKEPSEAFQRCSKGTGRMLTGEKVAYAERTLARLLKGDKVE